MFQKHKIVIGILAVIGVVAIISSIYSFVLSRQLSTATMGDDGIMLAQSNSFGLSKGTVRTAAMDMDVSEEMMPTSMPIAPGYGTGDSSVAIPEERLIIRTGELSMVVDDVKVRLEQIARYAEEKGGFVVRSETYKSGLAPRGDITVRIPVASFDSGIEDIRSFGDVTSQSVSGQDVTEEYVDLDAQVRNLRATENQFLEIMKRAVKIEDILAVQRELSNVRSDIDRLEGRMKYLRESAQLSTLSVHLSTDPDELPVVDDEDQWKPWAQVKEAFRSLLDMGKGLVNLVIWFVVYIPLWILIGLVIWVVRRVYKRRKKTGMTM